MTAMRPNPVNPCARDARPRESGWEKCTKARCTLRERPMSSSARNHWVPSAHRVGPGTNWGGAAGLPASGSDGGEHVHLVINKVGEGLRNERRGLAYLGIRPHQVPRGNARRCQQAARPLQVSAEQVPQPGRAHVADDEHILWAAVVHALLEPLPCEPRFATFRSKIGTQIAQTCVKTGGKGRCQDQFSKNK